MEGCQMEDAALYLKRSSQIRVRTRTVSRIGRPGKMEMGEVVTREKKDPLSQEADALVRTQFATAKLSRICLTAVPLDHGPSTAGKSAGS
jgi:hypothetical protein